MPDAPHELSNRHRDLTVELAGALRDLGMTKAALAEQKANAWWEYAHLGATERRESVSAVATQFVQEVAKLDAEVEALRVELAHVTLMLQLGG